MEMFIKEVMLLILLVVLFTLGRTNKKSREKGQVSTESFQEQIEMALTLAQTADAVGKREERPVSEESLQLLEAKGIKLDRPLNEMEAEHLLGLFLPPSARQVDILKHFKIPRTLEMNKTLANLYIQNIFSDPANVQEWNQRPATSRVKQGVLFVSGQLVSGMTQVEAQSKLMHYGMENPLKYREWKHIEKLFLTVNEVENLERHTARKITWKRFFQLYDAVKASGVQINEITVESILKQAQKPLEKEGKTTLSKPRLKFGAAMPATTS